MLTSYSHKRSLKDMKALSKAKKGRRTQKLKEKTKLKTMDAAASVCNCIVGGKSTDED